MTDRQIRGVIRDLRRRAHVEPAELYSLRRAWGNEGFSADLRYLTETMRLIREYPGDVLECGTGATTLLAGALAEHYGFRVCSLEQEPEWAASVGRVLLRNRLDRVTVMQAPLTMRGDHAWYDTSKLHLPRQWGVVICDGPAVGGELGEPVHSSWRYGVLDFLMRTRSRFAVLLVDDVVDPRAPEMLRKWTERFGVSVKIVRDVEGDFGIVEMPGNPREGAAA